MRCSLRGDERLCVVPDVSVCAVSAQVKAHACAKSLKKIRFMWIGRRNLFMAIYLAPRGC